VHFAGSRTAAHLVVEVTDEDGRPVNGVAVSFRLPASGPGGSFSNGLTVDVVITRSNGRAASPEIRWNGTPGFVEIQVTAVKGNSRASASVAQRLSPSHAAASRPVGARRRVILLLAAAAAGSVVAGIAMVRKSSAWTPAPAASTAGSLKNGAPTITIGGR